MLQEKVLQVIKSKALLDSVKQSNHKFSELELISIAYYFSDTYEQRLNLLKEISAKCKTEAKILADKCIKYLEDSLNAFINPQKDAVYEVHIKDDPQSYDERYLCKTYNGALKIIELFHKCYECESEITDISRFTIYKRLCKDYDTVDEFDEDELGCCELGKGFIIKSVDFWEYHYSNCDKKCEECTDLCLQNITVQYPKFLNEYDIASYINYDFEKEYYIALCPEGYEHDDCAYLLPLNSWYLEHNDWQNVMDSHQHTEYPLVQKESYEALSDELKQNYQLLRSFLVKLGYHQ